MLAFGSPVKSSIEVALESTIISLAFLARAKVALVAEDRNLTCVIDRLVELYRRTFAEFFESVFVPLPPILKK